MRLAGAFFVALAILAGCMGTGSPGDDAGPRPAEPAGPPPSTGPFPFVPSAGWSNCEGFRAGIPGLTAMYDFEPQPPGWESDNPTTEFDLRFLTCERVSWGPFERGPVHMILELAGNFDNPESCNGERATLLRNINSWWFSDADVASYARDAYGANAYAANFSVTTQATAETVDHVWEWGQDGMPRSSARFPDVNLPTQQTTHVTRIFWFVGNGTYAMDFSQEWQMPPPVNHGSAFRPSVGRLEEPMLYASAGDQNDFAARTERYVGLGIAADFFRFEDYQCTKPL